MISQSKKKIYIIGINPLDIGDCTVQAIEKIRQSELIILPPKSGNSFIYSIKNKNNIYLQEDLSKKNNIFLWKKILNLLKQNQTIGHLVDGDPFIDHDGFKESNFFLEKDIKCEIIPGVIRVINNINKNLDLLTDREKNSSVTFMKPFNLRRLTKIVKNSHFEKLVVYIKSVDEINDIKSMLINYNSNYKINLNFRNRIFDNDGFNFSSKFPTPCYIIIEKNE